MAYGPDSAEIFRQSASYIDRILNRESPAKLLAQAPTKFEFVINFKTAKALGLSTEEPARNHRSGDRIEILFAAVYESASGTKRTIRPHPPLSAIGVKRALTCR